MSLKISIVSFSQAGGELAARVRQIMDPLGTVEAFAMPRYAGELKQKPILPSLSIWCSNHWSDDVLIFIGASGIAVRTIAPCVRSKVTDPAVLVMDEAGKFVISLLSGHLGGANEWTSKLAEALEAVPVITTATDVRNRFAVDVWAKENGLVIDSMKIAKEISAEVLKDHKVLLTAPMAVMDGDLPVELTLRSEEAGNCEIFVDPRSIRPPEESYPALRFSTLRLIPKCISIGIGCRRDQSAEAIRELVVEGLKKLKLDPRSIEGLYSIDLKKNEKGILQLSNIWNIPFHTFTSEELLAVPGEFTASSFVSGIVGVDNVCERSAVLGSNHGQLLLKKLAKNGVTVAIAMGEWRIKF